MTTEEVLQDIQENKKIAEGLIIGAFINQIDLISDYEINSSKLSDVSRFYYNLISNLYATGYKDVDKVTVHSYLKNYPDLLSTFNEYGGFNTLKGLANASSTTNIGANVSALEKYVLLEELHAKQVFDITAVYEDKLKLMKDAQTISAWYEYQLNEATLGVSYSDIKFESFEITDSDIDYFKQGNMIGVRYNTTSPLLDYATLGFPKGDFSIIGSFINHGKTSFTAYTAFGMAKKQQKIGIIANEQDLLSYKQLLIMYVMVHELQYLKLKRKTLKMGAWTKEDEEYLSRARDIIKEKYAPYLSFLEVFDYDTSVVSRAIKRWAKMGFSLIIYDTLKADFTNTDGWVSLIKSTRELYQLAHRDNIAVVGVMQLRMAELNRRVLDLDVLANGRQSSETASEVMFFRNLFADEMPGEANEATIYRYKKDSEGKYTSIKEIVTLKPDADPDEYKVFFIAKTRNDKVGTAVVYRFSGDYNVWQEIGYIDIVDDCVAS